MLEFFSMRLQKSLLNNSKIKPRDKYRSNVAFGLTIYVGKGK